MSDKEQRFGEICKLAGVDSVTAEMLAMRLGVGRDAMRLRDIGQHYDRTREAIRVRLVTARGKIGEDAWAELGRLFPKLTPKTTEAKRFASERIALRAYFEDIRESSLNYGDICDVLGLKCTISKERAYALSVDESCRLIAEKYGLKYFGRCRICSRCDAIKPVGEFYKSENNSGECWTICKACNTERCREWSRKNRLRVNANRKKWCRENPERAKAATERWRRKRNKALENLRDVDSN